MTIQVPISLVLVWRPENGPIFFGHAEKNRACWRRLWRHAQTFLIGGAASGGPHGKPPGWTRKMCHTAPRHSGGTEEHDAGIATRTCWGGVPMSCSSVPPLCRGLGGRFFGLSEEASPPGGLAGKAAPLSRKNVPRSPRHSRCTNEHHTGDSPEGRSASIDNKS